MRSSTWWMIGGILCIIGGFLALFNPLAGSMAATFVAAWAFLIAGILQIIGVFQVKGGWNKLLLFLFGALGVLVGITLFKNPLEGMLSLTLAVALMILVSGVVRFFLAFDLKGTSSFWWVIISAVVSVILGLMILSGFPQDAAGILGILLGVELVFDGVALIGLSNASKKVEDVIAPSAS